MIFPHSAPVGGDGDLSSSGRRGDVAGTEGETEGERGGSSHGLRLGAGGNVDSGAGSVEGVGGIEGVGRAEREQRTNLFLAARLALFGEPPRDVKVRNLSPSGARIDTPDPPRLGTTLLLCRGTAQVAAEVIWVAAGSCGLRFSEVIDVARWISDRPGALPAALSREPSLADNLGLARQLVDRLEDALASRPDVVASLGTELLGLDLLAQLLKASEKRAAYSTAPSIRSLSQAIGTFLRDTPGGSGTKGD
jgi:hypothetical protein